MRAIQLEVGLVVIEIPGFPVAHVVAGFACRSQFALMYIFLFMARPAIGLGVLECRSCVTLFALHQKMFADQREYGFSMIEGGLFPGFFLVAGFAFLAFLAFVLVIFFMAGIALGIELVLIQIAFVATGALHILMFAQQWILR